MKDRKEETILTFNQSITAGALAGFAQAVFSLPFWTMKVRIQCEHPFTLNPLILYKGFNAAASSISFMSVSQVAFSAGLHRAIHRNAAQQQETSTERVVAALGGGLLSTLISNPVGVVITQQHKHPGSTFFKTAKSLKNQFGYRRFYVSFMGNSIVNTLFTTGFYGVYPLLNEKFSPPVACGLLGFLNSAITQGIDSAKTFQENAADQKHPPSLLKSLKLITNEKGVRGLYRGFFTNSISVGSATLCAGIAVEQVQKLFLRS